jgi:hypothetical protein
LKPHKATKHGTIAALPTFSIFIHLDLGVSGIFFRRQDSACFNKAWRFSDWGIFRPLVFWHGATRKIKMSISSSTTTASNWPQNSPTTRRALRSHTDPYSLTTIATFTSFHFSTYLVSILG